ncbi:MAG: RNA polymerase sigma factor [Bdellovibrionales bacterium]|nr:RNA polymerase sigma factor [Bdellovibrionales bacterium]NQZ18388.1 RNA polymerase sigma factor [Bdellovibrionales bacterium]
MAITKEKLESVYHSLESSLFNFALRWVYNPVLAEELVHEAFIRVWKTRESVEEKTLKAFLFKTVQNLCLNELRKRRLREALPFLEWFDNRDSLKPSMESSLINREELQLMKESLDKLPVKYKEVLLMSEFSDMSYQEIAKSLGVAEGTVASRKSRAMELLKTEVLQGVEYVR